MPEAKRSAVAPLVTIGVGSGVLSGLFGVGGGIVIVPLLTLLLGFAQKRAQATSLAAIVLTAAAGALSYLGAGQVLVAPAALIAVGGVAGSFVGAAAVHRMSDRQVRVVFSVVILVVAVRMLVGVEPAASGEYTMTAAAAAGFLAAGLVMGALSAMVGLGGGFVIVPILVLLFAVSPQTAQGTSLLVMVPISLVGAWRNSTHGYTDWRAGLLLGAGGVVGSPLGARVALALPSDVLQRLFGVLLVVVGARMLLAAVGRGDQRAMPTAG